MKKGNAHIVSVDYARIAGAFAVVSIHVTDELIPLTNHFGGLSWWYAVIFNSFSRTAVPLFIMISGYLLLNREKKIVSSQLFFRKRLSYVGIPLLVWTCIYYLWHLFFFNDPFTITDIAVSIWTVSVFHLHFLILITGLYLITPVLKRYTDTLPLIKLFTLTIIWSILSLVITFFTYGVPQLQVLKNMIISPLLFGCYYMYGQYIRRISLSRMQTSLFLILFIAAGFLTSGLVYLNMRDRILIAPGFGEYFQDPLSINILIMSFLLFPLLIKLKFADRSFIKKVGGATFGIYIFHPIVIDVINRFLPLNVHQIFSSLWFFMSLKIVLTFCLTCAAVLLFILLSSSSQTKS